MDRNGKGRIIVDDLDTGPPSPEQIKKLNFWYESIIQIPWSEVHKMCDPNIPLGASIDPRNSRHPSSNPDFDAKREHTVYYLSHPLAPDDDYTFVQNMNHVVHLMRIFFEEGWFVIAPYHTICLALDDDKPEHRVVGLECDCNVARMMGNLVLTGHKISSGMRHERDQAMLCKSGGAIYNFVGYSDVELREALRFLKNGGTLESDVRKEV